VVLVMMMLLLVVLLIGLLVIFGIVFRRMWVGLGLAVMTHPLLLCGTSMVWARPLLRLLSVVVSVR
jgi:hypothetical protein